MSCHVSRGCNRKLSVFQQALPDVLIGILHGYAKMCLVHLKRDIYLSERK